MALRGHRCFICAEGAGRNVLCHLLPLLLPQHESWLWWDFHRTPVPDGACLSLQGSDAWDGDVSAALVSWQWWPSAARSLPFYIALHLVSCCRWFHRRPFLKNRRARLCLSPPGWSSCPWFCSASRTAPTSPAPWHWWTMAGVTWAFWSAASSVRAPSCGWAWEAAFCTHSPGKLCSMSSIYG